MKKLSKEKKGITLISLVITIIILIILAGVLINIVLGNNGLFTLAKRGAKLYSDEQAREKVEIMLSEYQVEKYTDGKELLTFLEEQKTKGTIESYTDNEDDTIAVKVDGYDITIDKEKEKITDVSSSGNGVDETPIKYMLEGDTTIEGYEPPVIVSDKSGARNLVENWLEQYKNEYASDELDLVTYFLYYVSSEMTGGDYILVYEDRIVIPIRGNGIWYDVTVNKEKCSITQISERN